MCQAFEGEQRFMMYQEEEGRKRGYKAQQEGKSKDDNPELLPWIKRAWDLGFDIAEQGHDLW